MPNRPDYSEDAGLQLVALAACLLVAEHESDTVAHGADCVVDPEAAATVYFLASAGLTLPEAVAFLSRRQRMD